MLKVSDVGENNFIFDILCSLGEEMGWEMEDEEKKKDVEEKEEKEEGRE